MYAIRSYYDLAGTLIAYGVGPMVFEGTSITWMPVYLPLALLMAVIVAVISAVYPAFRATTIKVSDSFRSRPRKARG